MLAGDSNSILSHIRDPRRIFTKTSASLQKKFGYTNLTVLGYGSFGVVYKIKPLPKNVEVAIKCVHLDDLREGEKELWRDLLHPSIVPLLRYNVFTTINVAYFEMTVYACDLKTAVRKADFFFNSEALKQIEIWLYQVLSGLNYLHTRLLCHLDLKADNIFISQKTSRAIIGDFTCLSRTTNVRSDKVGLPIIYQPPETSWKLKDKKEIDGIYFDLWSYGVLSFEILTDFYLIRSFSNLPLCSGVPYITMRKCQQEHIFTAEMKAAFPGVEITPNDVQLALNFIRSFLKPDPCTRLTADSGMQHLFLKKRYSDKKPFDSSRQLTITTEENTNGPNSNQQGESTGGKWMTNWFLRRFNDLERFFVR